MRQTPQEQPESMEFPRREFESVCFHAIGLVDQNREYLQMHLRESGDAPTRQALADMELQTARLERTLSEMMDLMALEEDPVPSRRGFDLCSVLRQAASLREEMARQAKVHLTVSCEPDTCPVLGSPEEAELMVFHLLSNALRAYIRDQYGLDAVTRTSLEFLETLRDNAVFTDNEKAALAEFLEAADLLKYARQSAGAEEIQTLMSIAERLVRGDQTPSAPSPVS